MASAFRNNIVVTKSQEGYNIVKCIIEMESGMGREEELRMTYSGLLLKDGEKMVRVCFERGKDDFAEGIVPKGTIVKSSGFSREEIEQLTVYIQDNATDIINRAKNVNFLNDWLGKE